MEETILNIYLIIEDDIVTEFRVKSYLAEGNDDSKIDFLKSRAKTDYSDSEIFYAPVDKKGKQMNYRKFSKLEKQGRHFELFEGIFNSFNVPENPLICVTPVVNGELLC